MIEIKNLHKTYITKQGVTFRALNNINLSFEEKGLVFILGKSGSGKSTLLNLIGGLDRFEKGDIFVDGESLNNMRFNMLDYYRNTYIGFIFQDFNLLKNLNVYGNVKMALDIKKDKDKGKIDKTLLSLGIGDLANRKVHELSGGQKQRVGIARTLVKEPKIILADEPTGSLDANTSREIYDVLKKISEEKLIIVVSHDRELAYSYGERIIEIADGQIIKDLHNKQRIAQDEQTISFVGQSFFHIPEGKSFESEHLEKLNEVLIDSYRDIYISFETKTNKVKSFYPHLRDSLKKNDDNELLLPYEFKKTENYKALNIVKSHLSFWDSMRLGINNIRSKIIRLMLIIIISIIAMTSFSLSDDLAKYHIPDSIAINVQNSDKPFTVFSQIYDKRENLLMYNNISNANLANLQSTFPEIKYCEAYQSSFTFNTIKNNILVYSFNGFIVAPTPEDMGIKLIYGDIADFTEATDIIISDVAAYSLVDVDIEISTLIGKRVTLNFREYVVRGIYDGNFKRYEPLLEEYNEQLRQEFDYFNNQYLGKLIVTEKFPNYYVKEFVSVMQSTVNVFGRGKYDVSIYNEDHMMGLFGMNLLWFGDSSVPLADDEWIVSAGYLARLLNINSVDWEHFNWSTLYSSTEGQHILDAIEEFNSENVLDYSITNGSRLLYHGKTGKIKAVIKYNFSNILYQKDILAELSLNSLSVHSIFVNNDFFKNDTSNKINKFYDNNLFPYEYYVEPYYDVDYIISGLGQTLLILSLVFTCLLIISLFSFITGSIRDSKSTIGTLRSLGTRKIDISKIFTLEAFLITLISIIISIFLYAIAASFINLYISASIFHNIYLIICRISTVINLIVVSITITVISLLIPLWKIMKMSPVESMKN